MDKALFMTHVQSLYPPARWIVSSDNGATYRGFEQVRNTHLELNGPFPAKSRIVTDAKNFYVIDNGTLIANAASFVIVVNESAILQMAINFTVKYHPEQMDAIAVKLTALTST